VVNSCPPDLRGISPSEVAARAKLNLSLAQRTALKAACGEPLDDDERSTFRTLTGTWFADPRPGGYQRVAICAGRRSGKTVHVAAPLAVSALLSRCDDLLAPGERGRVLLIGPTLDHVRQLLDGIAGVLDRLGVAFRRTEREIEPIGLRTIAVATVADAVAVRSGTALLAIVDEAALLPSEEGAAGRDVDVLASITPALATTGGRLILTSSPWGEAGALFDTFAAFWKKTSSATLAMRGATWLWHPALSEQKCHDLEPDRRTFDREYGAQFGHNSDAFISGGRRAILPSVDRGRLVNIPQAGVQYVCAVDAAFRRDRFVIAIAHREMRNRPDSTLADVTVVDYVRVLVPTPDKPIDFTRAIEEVAATAKRFNRATVLHDSFSSDALASALKSRGIRAQECPMHPAAQAARFDLLLSKLRSPDELRLPDDPRIVAELVDLRIKLHSGGRVEIAAPQRRGHHDDIADALALCVQGAAALPPGGGDLKCSFRASWGEGGLQTRVQWYREVNAPTGAGTGVERLPCVPPVGAVGWDQYVAQCTATGTIDPAVEKWKHEQGQYGNQPTQQGLNVPVRHNG
jgi:hypothetical protein